jgi:hypothetical protein
MSFSTDGFVGRTATNALAELTEAAHCAVHGRRVGLLKCGEQAGRRRGERMDRHHRAVACGEERAMRGGGEEWLARRGLHYSRHQCIGNGAMMRSMAPATGRQPHIVAGIEPALERPDTEDENEEDGERAAHLVFMLHEL